MNVVFMVTEFSLVNPEIPEQFARDIDRTVWLDPKTRYGKC